MNAFTLTRNYRECSSTEVRQGKKLFGCKKKRDKGTHVGDAINFRGRSYIAKGYRDHQGQPGEPLEAKLGRGLVEVLIISNHGVGYVYDRHGPPPDSVRPDGDGRSNETIARVRLDRGQRRSEDDHSHSVPVRVLDPRTDSSRVLDLRIDSFPVLDLRIDSSPEGDHRCDRWSVRVGPDPSLWLARYHELKGTVDVERAVGRGVRLRERRKVSFGVKSYRSLLGYSHRYRFGDNRLPGNPLREIIHRTGDDLQTTDEPTHRRTLELRLPNRIGHRRCQ